MFGKKKTPDQFSRYVDPTGAFTNKELNAGMWYVRNKILLARIGTIVLAVFAVSTATYALIAWGNYIIFGYTDDQRMLAYQRASFVDARAVQESYAPKDLMLLNAEVFESAPGKFDFSTLVKNPNPRYVGTISYKYIFDGGATETRDDVLLPGAERPVVFFGHESAYYPSAAQLMIEKVSWQRINPHTTANVPQFIDARLQFTTDKLLFVRGGEATGTATHQISFDVINKSAYSYWRPVFYVYFLQGESVTGIGYLEVPEFRSGETRRVELRSLAANISATDVLIAPIINVFDKSVFMSPGL